jgi:hypothetical protein
MSARTHSHICSHSLRLYQCHARPSHSRLVRCGRQSPAQRMGARYFLHRFYAPLTMSFVDQLREELRESKVRSANDVFCIWAR